MKRWIWIPVIIVLAGIAVTVRAFSIGITHRPDVPATPAMVAGYRFISAGHTATLAADRRVAQM